MSTAFSTGFTSPEGGALRIPPPVPIETFLARFPEFAQTDPNSIYYALVEADRQTSPTVWGYTRNDGLNYLAAHLLASRVQAVGEMIGAPVGPSIGTGLDSTRYGQEYKRLRDSLPITGFVI